MWSAVSCCHNRWRVLCLLLIWTCSVLSVIVDAHRFKRAPPSIVYWPFLDTHKNEINKDLCNFRSSTPKCSYLWFLKIWNIWITFLYGVPKKMGGNSKSSILFCLRVKHNCYSCGTFPYIPNCSSRYKNFAWDFALMFSLLEILLGDPYAIVLEMLCH